MTLGAPLTIGVEDPLGPERPVLAAPKPVATSHRHHHKQLCLIMPSQSDLPSPTLALETPEVASIPTPLQSETHLGTDSGALSDEVL